MGTRRKIAVLALPLCAWLLAPSDVLAPLVLLLEQASVVQLRAAAGVSTLTVGALDWLGLLFARGLPLGVLAVQLFPDRESVIERVLKVGLPAWACALSCYWLAAGVRAHGQFPSLAGLLLPGAGAALGAWAALAFRRGGRARLLFLPQLALVLLLCLGGFLGVLTASVETAPSLPEGPALTSEERRHLVAAFRGYDPRTLAPGETRTLRLDAREVDQLVAWAAGVGSKARTSVQLQDGGLSAAAAIPLSHGGRWLNLRASGLLALADGKLRLSGLRLAAGKVSLPSLLLDDLAAGGVALLERMDDMATVLRAIRSLSLTPYGAALSFSKLDAPPGLAARLFWGDQSSEIMHSAVQAQMDNLILALQQTPAGDARFAAALKSAFALARQRTARTSAIFENRAALLALGIVLGHERLARAVKVQQKHARWQLISDLRDGTTLRQRHDWTRHFTISGALTVLGDVAPSDAVGLLKEELDADGGSGFSFADWLADRSGTTLADIATRDETSARAMQERIGAGFRVDEFFPPADGLPEGIQDAEFKAVYGGVGGPLYTKLTAEVERRVAACSAYKH